jgi:hypothetical protein
MPRSRAYETPGWTQNLIRAAGVQPGERAVVLVDEPLAEEGSQLLIALRDVGAEPRLELWAGKRPLQHAPPAAMAALADATLMFFLSAEPRGDEAAARFETSARVHENGGRGVYLGLVDSELLAGELSQPALDLSDTARRLLSQLEGARELHVRGAAGTDLKLRVEGRPWRCDALPLQAGGFANYPNGEVYVAPHADGAEGLLVVDLTVPYTVNGLVDEPVRLRFEGGRAVSIEGGRAAQMLRELVADAGKGADVIAELGIGFNPTVAPRGHVMLDEKAAGTAHVAIGRNTGQYGGDNEAEIHVDCVFSAPQVVVDGRPIQLP